ncbi:universal stress protein [Acidisphaera sp. S103]|uniref:universal stress protein n=1 Tax=Acidisphaera sp. S103 TaxID=1747223 RepID=UPI00131D03C1|nr:universal stress protein [Acidisphaera sp. S103]
MPNVILAVVELPDVASRVLAAAGCLAQLTGAVRINGLAIRLPPIETVIRTEEILSEKAERRIRTEERQRADRLKGIFDAWAVTVTPQTVVTTWHDVEDRADKVVSEWGRRADFIVLKRPWQHTSETERQAIHAALFETDRPILMVPPDRPPTSFGKRVAIAWRQDSRTLKAMLAALRCLQGAEHIDVLAGVRNGAPQPRLPEILEEHGIKADLHVLPVTGDRVFGEVLLTKAHALGSDMLVVGAFARHPIRSLLLGGVTRHMLTHADLPVLMRH